MNTQQELEFLKRRNQELREMLARVTDVLEARSVYGLAEVKQVIKESKIVQANI